MWTSRLGNPFPTIPNERTKETTLLTGHQSKAKSLLLDFTCLWSIYTLYVYQYHFNSGNAEAVEHSSIVDEILVEDIRNGQIVGSRRVFS